MNFYAIFMATFFFFSGFVPLCQYNLIIHDIFMVLFMAVILNFRPVFLMCRNKNSWGQLFCEFLSNFYASFLSFFQVLFRYAIAIFKYLEDELLAQSDYMNIFNTLRSEVEKMGDIRKLTQVT